MSEPATAYEKLKDRFAHIAQLNNASAILSSDQEVSMPAGSAEDRAGQIVALAASTHMLMTAPEVAEWLDQAEKEKDSLPREDQRNLALMRRDWIHSASLPQELAEECARIYSEGDVLHTKHHKSGDWSQMRDWYAHSFETLRAVGNAKMKLLGVETPYDALIDTYAPGMTVGKIDEQFALLEKFLPDIIREAIALNNEVQAIPLATYTAESQLALCKKIALAMGFDTNRGRIDVIDGHPSSGGTPDDTRFTLGVTPGNFLDGVFSTIHECGHALYDQNRPAAWRYQPAGNFLGMNVHESQSRIMEVQFGHAPEFLEWLSKEAQATLRKEKKPFQRLRNIANFFFGPKISPDLTAENLEKLLNKPRASFIRIKADEITYSGHVMLRYNIEKEMINGTMTIDELPKAWNDGMFRFFGITPENPAQGHMQDVHHPCGMIGYFPDYTLGDMMAAQLAAAAVKAHPEIKDELRKGNFTPLREWLTENVHSKGSLLTVEEMLIKATGEPLNVRHYLNHLSERYLNRPFTGLAPKETVTFKPGAFTGEF